MPGRCTLLVPRAPNQGACDCGSAGLSRGAWGFGRPHSHYRPSQSLPPALMWGAWSCLPGRHRGCRPLHWAGGRPELESGRCLDHSAPLSTCSLSSAGDSGSWAACPLVPRDCPGPHRGSAAQTHTASRAGWPSSKIYFMRSRDVSWQPPNMAGFEWHTGGGTHWGGAWKRAQTALSQVSALSSSTEHCPGEGGGWSPFPAEWAVPGQRGPRWLQVRSRGPGLRLGWACGGRLPTSTVQLR